MSIYSTIQSLLDTNLKSVVGIPTIQLENTRAVGKTGQSFTRGTLLPARSNQISFGINGTDEYTGLYQIDIFVPQDTGTATANALIDSVLTQFARGTKLGDSTFNIRLGNSWRESGNRVEPFYNVSATVEWVYYK